MSTGEKIKTQRVLLGLSQEELGELIGVKKAAIHKYENEIVVNLKKSVIRDLAIALQCSPAYLMFEDYEQMGIDKLDNIVPIETQKIPLLGTIAAGVPIFAEEDFECYVECGVDIRADFALRVKGDSMINARITDGDIVFIRSQHSVMHGEIAAVLIDDEATLKRFKRYGDHIVLQAENPDFPDIEFDLTEDSSVRIIGKAIAFQSDVR